MKYCIDNIDLPGHYCVPTTETVVWHDIQILNRFTESEMRQVLARTGILFMLFTMFDMCSYHTVIYFTLTPHFSVTLLFVHHDL